MSIFVFPSIYWRTKASAEKEARRLRRIHGGTAQTMRLVWCGRTRAELDAMGPYLPEDTTVFLTRASAREGGSGAAPCATPELGGEVVPTIVPLVSPPPL